MAEETLNATVVLRRDISERLAIVRVEPTGWTLPPFEPGQAATLGPPDPDAPGKFVRRTYSVASAPGAGHMEFFLQLAKDGPTARRLWHLGEGDALFLSPRPAGQFTLDGVPPGADLALIGTGTGLAPYLSMLRTYRGTGRWRRCAIVHGARAQHELGFRAELEHWTREDDSLAYVPTLTREAEGTWSGARGRVQALIASGELERRAGLALDPEQTHVFVCGQQALVDELEQVLAARGYHWHKREAPGSLHFERWW